MSIIEKQKTIESTPQQTVGPYVTLGLMSGEHANLKDQDLTSEGGHGEEITVQGHFFGNDGKPLFNIMIEIWQANSKGIYNHPCHRDKDSYNEKFIGFGRDITDEAGAYSFTSYKPGPVEETGQDPHILAIIHASGVDHPLFTRIYFEDEAHDDSFIQSLDPDQAKSLIAKRTEEDGQVVYKFDIVMDGVVDELTLESKLEGKQLDEVPDGTGKPLTYIYALGQ